jgi:beta-glucanase (GH16 family)
MTAALSRHHRLTVTIAATLTLGLWGCGQSTSSGGAGGATSGTGGSSTAMGGNPTGTGGATSSTGGTSSGGATTGTGGQATGTAGSTTDTGGTAAGTGGRTTGSGAGGKGTGGGAADAGADTGAVRTDGSAGPEIPPDTSQPKDSAPDAGPGQNDAPLADTAPQGDGGINVPDGYKLVWSDEFNTDGTPDSKNWNYEKGFVRNNELQWYQSNNATVKGGLLIIEGRKEQVNNTNYQPGSSSWKTNRQYAQYTSTSMRTMGLQSWQYGRFEMRARIPTSTGMWPAWWTLGNGGSWPADGEIDIMEYYKGNVLANVACERGGAAHWDSSTKAISSLRADWSSSFHIWRMDWDDVNINLYLDDTLMNSVKLADMLNSDGNSPFKQPVYMLVNLAIGGDNGGDPSGTTFPVQYEVDYVRVFQKL